VPLRAVPFMLDGHRDLAPLEPGIEARIVWRHLLLTPPRGAVPGRSWAERPRAMLLEIVRFFVARPGGAWTELARTSGQGSPPPGGSSRSTCSSEWLQGHSAFGG
jgi:hypothetical protein